MQGSDVLWMLVCGCGSAFLLAFFICGVAAAILTGKREKQLYPPDGDPPQINEDDVSYY